MRGSTLITREQAIRHECGHAAGLFALGLEVTSVDVLQTPTRHGFTAHNLRVLDPATARLQALHTMTAFIAEGANAVPVWPLDQGPVTSTDEQQLARIASACRWGETDYTDLVHDACQLMVTPRFKKAYHALHDALQSTSRLDEHALQRLLPSKPERKVFRTSWVTPGPFDFDRYGWQVLADRDAARRRARTAQAAARHTESKRARAEMLALEEAIRARRERQRIAPDLDSLTRVA